jgi:hypothetical protein
MSQLSPRLPLDQLSSDEGTWAGCIPYMPLPPRAEDPGPKINSFDKSGIDGMIIITAPSAPSQDPTFVSLGRVAGNGGLQFVALAIPKQSEADEKRRGLQIDGQ